MARHFRDNELIESACRHVISEFGLENVEPSFRMESSALQRAHDAIHEFALLAALLAPSATGAHPSWKWQSKSAFFLYHLARLYRPHFASLHVNRENLTNPV